MFKELYYSLRDLITAVKEKKKKAFVFIALICTAVVLSATGGAKVVSYAGYDVNPGTGLFKPGSGSGSAFSIYVPCISVTMRRMYGVKDSAQSLVKSTNAISTSSELKKTKYFYGDKNSGYVKPGGWNAMVVDRLLYFHKDLGTVRNAEEPSSMVIMNEYSRSSASGMSVGGWQYKSLYVFTKSSTLSGSVEDKSQIYMSDLGKVNYNGKTYIGYATISESTFNKYSKAGVFYDKLNTLLSASKKDDVNARDYTVLSTKLTRTKVDNWIKNNSNLKKYGAQVISYIADVSKTGSNGFKQSISSKYKTWMLLGYNNKVATNSKLKIGGKQILKKWSSYPSKSSTINDYCNPNKSAGKKSGFNDYASYIQNEYNMHYLDLLLCYYALTKVNGSSKAQKIAWKQIETYLNLIDYGNYGDKSSAKNTFSVLEFNNVMVTRGKKSTDSSKVITGLMTATNLVRNAYSLGDTDGNDTSATKVSYCVTKWFTGFMYKNKQYGVAQKTTLAKTKTEIEENSNWTNFYTVTESAIKNYNSAKAKTSLAVVCTGLFNGREAMSRIVNPIFQWNNTSKKVTAEGSNSAMKNLVAFVSMSGKYASSNINKLGTKTYSTTNGKGSISTANKMYSSGLVWGYPWRAGASETTSSGLTAVIASSGSSSGNADKGVIKKDIENTYKQKLTVDLREAENNKITQENVYLAVKADGSYNASDIKKIINQKRKKTSEANKKMTMKVTWEIDTDVSDEAITASVSKSNKAANISSSNAKFQTYISVENSSDQNSSYNRGCSNVTKYTGMENVYKRLDEIFGSKINKTVWYVKRGTADSFYGEKLHAFDKDCYTLLKNKSITYKVSIDIYYVKKGSSTNKAEAAYNIGSSSCKINWTYKQEEGALGEINIGHNSCSVENSETLSWNDGEGNINPTGVAKNLNVIKTIPSESKNAAFTPEKVNLECKLTTEGKTILKKTISDLGRGDVKYVHYLLTRQKNDGSETKISLTQDKLYYTNKNNHTTYNNLKNNSNIPGGSLEGGKANYYVQSITESSISTGNTAKYTYNLYTWIDDASLADGTSLTNAQTKYSSAIKSGGNVGNKRHCNANLTVNQPSEPRSGLLIKSENADTDYLKSVNYYINYDSDKAAGRITSSNKYKDKLSLHLSLYSNGSNITKINSIIAKAKNAGKDTIYIKTQVLRNLVYHTNTSASSTFDTNVSSALNGFTAVKALDITDDSYMEKLKTWYKDIYDSNIKQTGFSVTGSNDIVEVDYTAYSGFYYTKSAATAASFANKEYSSSEASTITNEVQIIYGPVYSASVDLLIKSDVSGKTDASTSFVGQSKYSTLAYIDGTTTDSDRSYISFNGTAALFKSTISEIEPLGFNGNAISSDDGAEEDGEGNDPGSESWSNWQEPDMDGESGDDSDSNDSNEGDDEDTNDDDSDEDEEDSGDSSNDSGENITLEEGEEDGDGTVIYSITEFLQKYSTGLKQVTAKADYDFTDSTSTNLYTFAQTSSQILYNSSAINGSRGTWIADTKPATSDWDTFESIMSGDTALHVDMADYLTGVNLTTNSISGRIDYDITIHIYYYLKSDPTKQMEIIIPGNSVELDLGSNFPAPGALTDTLETNEKTEAYAELKEGSVYAEEFEAMAAVPSTRPLYFATGGSEFIVNMQVSYEYTQPEEAIRTYHSHFDGTECEYKTNDQLESLSAGASKTETFVADKNDKTQSKTVTAENNSAVKPSSAGGLASSNTTTNAHNSATTFTATWTGTIANNTAYPTESPASFDPGKVTGQCPGINYDAGNGSQRKLVNAQTNWNVSNYNTAVDSAIAWAKSMEKTNDTADGTVYKIADSDGTKRVYHVGDAVITVTLSGGGLSKSIAVDGKAANFSSINKSWTSSDSSSMKLKSNDSTVLGSGWSYSTGTDGKGSGHVNACGGHLNICSSQTTDGEGKTIHTHVQHNPGTFTAGKDMTTGASAAISYKIVVTFKNGYTTATNYDGVGDGDYLTYAEKKSVGTSLPAHALCGGCCEHDLSALDDTWEQHLYYDTIKITNLSVWKLESGYVTEMSEIRSGEKGNDSYDTVRSDIVYADPNVFYNIALITTQSLADEKDKSASMFTNSSAAGRLRYSIQTAQDDHVLWQEMNDKSAQTRTNKCDGTSQTNNSRTGNPVSYKTSGHNRTWAKGCLYTHTTYGNILDQHKMDKNAHTPDNTTEDLVYTYDNGTVNSYKSTQDTYVDSIDMDSYEWKRFNMRRNMDVTVNVASDFLILQTSSGNQSVLYYEDSNKAKAQEDFDDSLVYSRTNGHVQEADSEELLQDNRAYADYLKSIEEGTSTVTNANDEEVEGHTCTINHIGKEEAYDKMWTSNKYVLHSLVIHVGGYQGTGDTETLTSRTKYRYTGADKGAHVDTIFDNDASIYKSSLTDEKGVAKVSYSTSLSKKRTSFTSQSALINTMYPNKSSYLTYQSENGRNSKYVLPVTGPTNVTSPASGTLVATSVGGSERLPDRNEGYEYEMNWSSKYSKAYTTPKYVNITYKNVNNSTSSPSFTNCDMLLLADKITQCPTNANREYDTGQSYAFYKQIINYTDATGNYKYTSPVKNATDSVIGENGYTIESSYNKSGTTKCNDITVYDPVSVQNAKIITLEDEGKTDLDQRVYDSDYSGAAAANAELEESYDGCPGSAALCEYRQLDCTYGSITPKASFSIDGYIKDAYDETDENTAYYYVIKNTLQNEDGEYYQKSLDGSGFIVNEDSSGNAYMYGRGESSLNFGWEGLSIDTSRTTENYSVKAEFTLRAMNSYTPLITIGMMQLGVDSSGYIVVKETDGTIYRSTTKVINVNEAAYIEFDFFFGSVTNFTVKSSDSASGDDTTLEMKKTTEGEGIENANNIGEGLYIGNDENVFDKYETPIDVDNISIKRLPGTTVHTDACYTSYTNHSTTFQNYYNGTYGSLDVDGTTTYTYTKTVMENGIVTQSNVASTKAEFDACPTVVNNNERKKTESISYSSGSGSMSYGSGGIGGTLTGTSNASGTSGAGFGQGGSALTGGYYGSGGGGGGYYGGSAGTNQSGGGASGGGGSGYANTSKLVNISGQTGVRSGNGYVTISGAINKSYDYTGLIQSINLQPGTYTFEVWGAQGGASAHGAGGGLGGYSKGTVTFNSATTIYIGVGGMASNFNGGGYGYSSDGNYGGGATHIATTSGELSNLASNKDSILIVAGGGGAAGCSGYAGGAGGGANMNGNPGTPCDYSSTTVTTVTRHTNTTYENDIDWLGKRDEGQCTTCSENNTHTHIADECITTESVGLKYAYHKVYTYVEEKTGALGDSSDLKKMLGDKLWNALKGSIVTSSEDSDTGKTLISFEKFIKMLQGYYNTNPDWFSDTVTTDGHTIKNPLWTCKCKYDKHVCNDECETVKELNCSEPHHCSYCSEKGYSECQDPQAHYAAGYYSHYDYTNEICYEACHVDAAHRAGVSPENVTEEIKAQSSLGSTILLDNKFQVYFPSKGNFYNTNNYGLSTLQQATGIGYTNNMSTSEWTREKFVKFPFSVLYNRNGTWEEWEKETWIPIEIWDNDGNEIEYYDFYCQLRNDELSEVEVQFAAEAVNNNDQALSSNFTPYERDNSLALDCPESSSYMTNKQRTGAGDSAEESYTAYHSAWKNQFLDVIGRIGNLVIEDTEDLRFSNLFKKEDDSGNWLIEGVLKATNEAKQNFYLMWHNNDGSYNNVVDVRGLSVSEDNEWYNTYGTQEWAAIASNKPTPVSESVNNVTTFTKGDKNLKLGYNVLWDITSIGNYHQGNMQITPYIYVLDTKTDTLYPVDVYSTDNETQAINYFGLMDLYDSTTEEQSEEYTSLSSNIYDYVMPLKWTMESARRNYTETEAAETEYVSQEYGDYITDSNGDFITTQTYNAGTGTYETSYVRRYWDIPYGEYYRLGNLQLIYAQGRARTFIGNSRVTALHDEINGDCDTELDEEILPDAYYYKAQRWHMTLGLPTSAMFIPYMDYDGDGVAEHKSPTDVVKNADNENVYAKNFFFVSEDDEENTGRYVALLTADIIVDGEVYTLHYTQGENNGSFTLEGYGDIKKTYSFGSNSYKVDGIEKTTLENGIPTLIAVYDINANKGNRVDLMDIQSH